MDLTKLSSYDYNLPKELIAQKAHSPADECKLLYYKNGEIKDLIFKDILDYIGENDVLFFNNSKVVKARIKGDLEIEGDSVENENKIKFYIIRNGEKKQCVNCEILFLKKLENNIFEALVRPGKKFKIGTKIEIEKQGKIYDFEITDFTEEGRIIKYYGNEDIFNVLEQIGQIPLPPYISYSKDKEKPYQPVQAKKEGSVAAPTASLHFTKDLFQKLKEKKVKILESTLHIGIGTFKTVDVEDITKYNIHSELVEIPIDIFEKIGKLKQEGKNIIAVGTTATRILESLPYLYKKLVDLGNSRKFKVDYFDSLLEDIEENNFIEDNIVIGKETISFNTKLYIYPGFKYKIVDKLITNFHLPKSSLLMLVSAFMGYDEMKKVYQHAIENKYRFFSFGDAMMVDK